MVKKSITLGALALISISFTQCGPPSGKQLPNVADQKSEGEQLFTKNCSSCHGPAGDLGVGGASDLSTSQLSLGEKIQVISKGRNAMQAYSSEYGGNLTPKNIQTIAEYIESTIKIK